MKKYHIGCSGYFYKEWAGNFYPKNIPTNRWLQYYCEHFNTVEINASFYKFPETHNLLRWHNKTPSDFSFSIKAPQMITHYTKFADHQLLNRFYEVAKKGLKEKIKCILFQLPPSLKYTSEFLDNMLKALSPNFTNVIEFRHESWWNQNVFEAFKSKGIVFCNISYPGLPEDLLVTSSLVYIRLHGKTELYKSIYTKEEIALWSKNILSKEFVDLYMYFNNTWNMGAIENALEIKKLLHLINSKVIPEIL